ncbi:Major Facilitator Superfamily protein [Variovorax sp. PDC80]|nr:Major Facilitator Superfamily protein [Variovorax sp. PDC80]
MRVPMPTSILTTPTPADAATRGATLAAACLSMAAIAMSITAAGVALVPIGAAFGIGFGALQWVLNLFVLSFAAFLLPAGALADRIGQRRSFIAGGAIFSTFTLMAVLAARTEWLLVARFLQGAGGALLAASGPAALTAVFHGEAERKRAFGWLGSCGGVGLTLGALLSGAAAARGGWRAALAIHLPLVLAALALALWNFRGHAARPAGARFDLVGAVLGFTAIAAAMAFGILGAEHGWGASAVLACLALALVAGSLFARSQRRHPAPLLPPALLRNRGFVFACLLTLLFTTVWVAMFIYVPLHQQAARGHDADRAGRTLLALLMPAMVMPALASRLAVRIGTRAVLVGGCLAMAAGLGLLYLAWTDLSRPAALEWLALAICGSGAGCLYGLLDYLAMASLPNALAGTGSAAFNVLRLLGDALGAIVPGAVLVQALAPRLAAAIGEPVPREVLNAVAAGQFGALASGGAAAVEAFRDAIAAVPAVLAVLVLLGAVLAWWRAERP